MFCCCCFLFTKSFRVKEKTTASITFHFPLNQQPFFEIRDGRHPCISRTFSGGDFIPNDTVVGIKNVSTSFLFSSIMFRD